jgi:hypothetical protein
MATNISLRRGGLFVVDLLHQSAKSAGENETSYSLCSLCAQWEINQSHLRDHCDTFPSSAVK